MCELGAGGFVFINKFLFFFLKKYNDQNSGCDKKRRKYNFAWCVYVHKVPYQPLSGKKKANQLEK